VGTPVDNLNAVAEQVSNFLHQPGDTTTAVYFAKLWTFRLVAGEGVGNHALAVEVWDEGSMVKKSSYQESTDRRKDLIKRLVAEALAER
jgi:hypothetical protein